MISHLAAIILPEDTTPPAGLYEDPLQEALIADHSVQVPIMRWPALRTRLLRISAQAYNSPAQYEHLASALKALL
jgi:isopenicillin-N epimerase